MTTLVNDPEERYAPWATANATDIAGLSIPEAITASGLDYTVEKLPLRVEIAQPENPNPALRLPRIVPVDDKAVTVRTDTGDTLGLVGHKYHVIQTSDVMNIMTALVGDGWKPQWAGHRKNGAQTFMFGELPYEFKNYPDMQPYMGFMNSFDGTTSLRFVSTSLVPSCTNALTHTFYGRGGKNLFGFKHTPNVWTRIDEAREALQLQVRWAEQFDQQIGDLLDHSMVAGTGKEFIEELVPVNVSIENGTKVFRDGAGKLISERAADGRINKRQNILNNWHNSETILNGKRWTAWGLVQAISELEQHANSGDSEKRTDRLMDRVTKGRVGSLTETAFHKLVNA